MKAALTPKQIEEFNLIPQMKAKAGSSRRKGFIDKHGDDVFELESLASVQLPQIVKEAIESVLDHTALRREQEQEAADAARVAAFCRLLLRTARESIAEFGAELDLRSLDSGDD